MGTPQVCLALSMVCVGALLAAVAADEVPRGVGSWSEKLGNHRAVVRVARKADAVWAHIPWRRRDGQPERKAVHVYDAATSQRVKNVVRIDVNREFGDIAFQPTSGPGDYHVHYLPLRAEGWAHSPKIHYVQPRATADAAWLAKHRLAKAQLAGDAWRKLPKATVVAIEAINEFHRFDPMEVVATAEETKALLAKHPEPYLLFPENRRHPIRMTDDLPLRWVRRGPSTALSGQARRGEFYAFQIGVYAARKAIGDLAVEIGGLRSDQGAAIPASAFHSFNTRGTDWLGRPIARTVSVPKGKVQALWFGVQVPNDAAPGTYRGTVAIRPKGAKESVVKLSLAVSADVLADGGVGDLWRMARLKWLDSTIGLDDEVVAPYTPLTVRGRTVGCLGREVRVGPTGLPESIVSRFPRTVDRVDGKPRELLAGPVAFVVETAGGAVAWAGGKPKPTRTAPGAVLWEARNRAAGLTMTCKAKMEADGYTNFAVLLAADRATAVKDIRLDIPIRRDVATYMMGFGRKGGLRPKEWKWRWDIGRAHNMVWLGDVNAGLQCRLKESTDAWNIGTLHATGIPQSWANGGKGGATVAEQGDAVTLRATSGPRTIEAGETLDFRFAFLITPLKPLDPAHWAQRYYHYHMPVVPVAKVAASGATIINCHHGNELNPHINYPFPRADALAAYVKEAHAKGIKVKIYYTVRELSNYVAELWALRSLGHEVFTDGGGGGHSWLQEHLVSHYGAAWHQPLGNGRVDAAIRTVGLSRWHNYYLEGLGWLVRNVGIDGIYLDGIGYDREIMKRVRKVMDRARPGCLIDFHNGNTFGYRDLRMSPVNKHMEHLPYINSLWFGEGFDYDESPDYWLVEISGIPFGLFGEMLQRGGNPWRGMVYGMTSRLGWGGDPREMWKVWDGFGIADARMFGYWDPACPVKASHEDVLATAYVRKGRTLVAVASWAKEPVECTLEIDWRALGLDSKKATLFAPKIPRFQPPALFLPTDSIPFGIGRGWLLVLDEEKHEAPTQAPRDVYAGRALLLEDGLTGPKLDKAWAVHRSAKHKTTLKATDKGVAIEAPANACAFVERTLPKGTTLVECEVCSGNDNGASWGPGLALVWPKRILRINLRAPEGRLGVDDGSGQWFGGYAMRNAWHRLRLRIDRDEVVAESTHDGRWWEIVHSAPRGQFPGHPTAVRVGKMSPGARSEDFHHPGPIGACSIRRLRVFGDAPGR